MALNANEVQQLYVAYLGRAADPDGLEYWTTQVPDSFTLADLRWSLVNAQQEYQDLYGGLSREEVITAIYQNMFGREPEAAGLDYWVNGGGADVPLDELQQLFIEAASPEDRQTFEDKVENLTTPTNVFTLTEIPSQTVTELVVGDNEVPADMALAFLQDVAKLDLVQMGLMDEDGNLTSGIGNITIEDNTDGQATININTSDGDLLSLAFDGNLALLAQVLFEDYLDTEETTTQTGIVLTPSANNGGAFEGGFTTAADDHIIAGRTELLHGAYIDGGPGYNTLEVDMKGVYAQPFQLLNIQEVQVQNLPNVYDLDQTIWADEFNFPNVDSGFYDFLSGSTLDLSRASSLEKLVINEGQFTYTDVGPLTIAGIKGDAVARLEGNLTQDVNLFYGRGLGDAVELELANVTMSSGDLTLGHNAGAVNLLSEGRLNVIESAEFGDYLRELNVSGTGELAIQEDLNFAFGEAHIDASANTGGIRLSISETAGSNLEEVTILGSQGRDVVEVSGTAPGVYLDIDLGEGRDTLILDGVDAGAHSSILTNALVSEGNGLVIRIEHEGQGVTTTNLSKLTSDSLNPEGLTHFIIDDGAVLTLTQTQLSDIGAAKFLPEHSNADARVNVLVTDTTGPTVLSDLIDLSALNSDVNLSFEIAAGAELTLTAEEFHEHLAGNAIFGEGVLNITDAGLGFDATDASGSIGGGLGTIVPSNFDGTVNIVRSADGFERPEADPDTDVLLIDTTDTGGVVVDANDISDVDAFSTAATTVIIQGDDDITFNVPVEMTSADFTLDFSGLTGALNDLTIREFNNVEEVIGNGAGVRIDVELEGDVGEEGEDSGLISSGVEQYVVVDINDIANDDGDSDAGTASFHLCDNTQDVEVIGLQGNAGNTLTFTNIPWGAVNPTVLLEGDGYGNWDELPKAASNPNASNVGTVRAEYFFPGAPANVLITNQGADPGLTSDGALRPIVVDGIEVQNAQSLNITAEDGNSVISDLVDRGNGETGLSYEPLLEDVTLTSANDVDLYLTHDNGFLESIDASAVQGEATLVVESEPSGTPGLDLSGTVLTDIDAVVMQNGTELTLTIDQIQAIGAANFSVENDGDTATLNVGEYDGSAFDFGGLGLDGINVGTVTTEEGTVVVDAATDFTGITQLIVPAGSDVTISAAQFKQLVESNATIVTGAASGDLDAGALTVDLDGDLTIGTADEAAIAGSDVTFEMADGETLNVEEFSLANGLQVTGDAAAATKPLVNFLFDSPQDDGSRFDETIDVADYQDVDLRIEDLLLDNFWIDANSNGTEEGGENSQSIEDLLEDLASANILNIYQEEVVAPTLDPRDREVVVEPEAEPNGIEFSAEGSLADYVRSIDLTLQASAADAATINGDISVNDGQNIAGFTMLTINAEDVDGAAAGPVTINGDILSDAGSAGATGELTDVVVNADHDIVVNGTLEFGSLISGSDATLTLNGAGDITITALDATDSDIDTLNIVNNATGTVNVPGASPATEHLAGDGTVASNLVISGTGSEINFGTADDPATDTVDESNSGVAVGDLDAIDASGYEGDLNLGILTGTVESALTVTGSQGVTTLTLGAANDDNSNDLSAGAIFAMDDTDEVTIDLSGSAAGSRVTLTDAVTVPVFTTGSLTISAETLAIEGNVDLRSAGDQLDLSGVGTIELAEGATVQMTDEQFAAFEAAGGTITGPGTSLLVDMDLVTALGDADLTEVRGLTELQLVAADDVAAREVSTALTLTFDQAELTTQYYYDADGSAEGEFKVVPVDANGAVDETSGTPAQAGDFRAFGPDVAVDVSGDADLTDLQGVTTFDLPADTDAADLNDLALTARDDQLTKLDVDGNTASDGPFSPSGVLAQLSSLTVAVQVDTGNTDIDSNPIIVESAVNFTYDAGADEWNVTGNAAAIGEAQKAADFSALLNEATSVTWSNVGTTASMVLEDGATADLTAATGDDTFVFGANVDTDVSSSLVITGFGSSGTDTIDLSALTGAASLTEGPTFAMADDSVFFLGGQAAGAADSDAGAATAISAATTDNVDMTGSYVVIADDNSSALYQVSNTGGDANDIAAGDLTLIGTIDNAALVVADITVA